MSQTSNKIREQIDIFKEMKSVFEKETIFGVTEYDLWKHKYNIILSLARELRELGINSNYYDPDINYDPDISYQEDVTACYRAYEHEMVVIAHLYGIEL